MLYTLIKLQFSSIYHAFFKTTLEITCSAHALGGVSGVASFITTDEQLQ